MRGRVQEINRCRIHPHRPGCGADNGIENGAHIGCGIDGAEYIAHCIELAGAPAQQTAQLRRIVAGFGAHFLCFSRH